MNFEGTPSENPPARSQLKLSYLGRYISSHSLTLHPGLTKINPNAQHLHLPSSTYKSLNLWVYYNKTVAHIYHCVFSKFTD